MTALRRLIDRSYGDDRNVMNLSCGASVHDLIDQSVQPVSGQN